MNCHGKKNYYDNGSYNGGAEFDDFCNRSMLGPFDGPNPIATANRRKTCDPDVIKEAQDLIEGINNDLLLSDDDYSSGTDVMDEKSPADDHVEPKKVELENHHDESHDDKVEESPKWYEKLVCACFV